MYKTCDVSRLAGLGAVLFVLFLSPTVGAVPLNAFIPFGPSVDDTRLPVDDNSSSPPISLYVPFYFFGVPQLTLFVNTNDNITFGASLSDFTPFAFPSGNKIIAPYSTDVDTRGSPDVSGDGLNDVYFRTWQVQWQKEPLQEYKQGNQAGRRTPELCCPSVECQRLSSRVWLPIAISFAATR